MSESKFKCELKFEPRDLWIGVYWDYKYADLYLHICLIPMLPICLIFHGDWVGAEFVRVNTRRSAVRLIALLSGSRIESDYTLQVTDSNTAEFLCSIFDVWRIPYRWERGMIPIYPDKRYD
ncbi:hypothetical protein [Kamptonema sp. UHCC 0994]|uniref:hypothetical protein n=1 Tax=Kamptonema sp. UHCC 0994 TaxID=3031329 RepID=UPI0023B9440E|nr:hypothetical protein [Kamptonema sp. UHCC 0994]MDF0554892.1 hypothetical protein [Kamptonema sp. UHCC 0994]